MDTICVRLDWLCFLGYDLDSEVPNHSVLSKARARWDTEVFRDFFERVVWSRPAGWSRDWWTAVRFLLIRAWWMRMRQITL